MVRERLLKILLALVGLLFSAAIYPPLAASIASGKFGHGRHDDDGHLFRPRYFSAHSGAKSSGASQPDRFRGVVEFCSCSDYACSRS